MNMKTLFLNSSDTELVYGCLRGDDEAWKEFLRRYNHRIDQAIVRTLRVKGHKAISNDDEGFWEIKGEVIEKLLKGIDKDITNLRGWINKICQNETIEWLRKKGAKKRAYERFVEDTSLSLDQPMDEEGDRTLLDSIPIENKEVEESADLVRKVKDCIEELDERYRLALKLLTIFYDPLSKEDIAEIARIRDTEKEVIEREINEITDQLVVKEEEILKKEAKKAFLWAYIHRLERHIAHLKSSPELYLEEIQKKEEELQKKITQRESLLKGSSPPVVPYYKDIARILGWGTEKAKTLNTLFFHARKILEKRMRKF